MKRQTFGPIDFVLCLCITLLVDWDDWWPTKTSCLVSETHPSRQVSACGDWLRSSSQLVLVSADRHGFLGERRAKSVVRLARMQSKLFGFSLTRVFPRLQACMTLLELGETKRRAWRTLEKHYIRCLLSTISHFLEIKMHFGISWFAEKIPCWHWARVVIEKAAWLEWLL